MKWEPQKARESQNAFFGKKGLPWHIACAVKRNQKGDLEAKSFIHVFDSCTQNGDSVCAILDDIMANLKAENPDLKEVALLLSGKNSS